MNLRKWKFPVVSDAEMAFPTIGTDKKLLAEAQARGFGEHTPYDHLFSQLFFKGGKLDFRDDLPPDFKRDASRYLRALMGSFEPKHEHKQAICALLLSELVKEPKKEQAEP